MSDIKYISINPNLKIGENQYRNNNHTNKPISNEYMSNMSNIHPNIQVHKAGSYHNSQEYSNSIEQNFKNIQVDLSQPITNTSLIESRHNNPQITTMVNEPITQHLEIPQNNLSDDNVDNNVDNNLDVGSTNKKDNTNLNSEINVNGEINTNKEISIDNKKQNALQEEILMNYPQLRINDIGNQQGGCSKNDILKYYEQYRDEIDKRVDKYIRNYKSDRYQTYLRDLGKLYSNISKKNKIETKNNYILIYPAKKTPKNYITKITFPEYIYLSDAKKEIDLNISIVYKDLIQIRDKIIRKNKLIDKSDIAQFNQSKDTYLDLIKERVTYQKYFERINEIDTNVSTLTININKLTENTDDKDINYHYMVGSERNIPEELVNNINEEESKLFELYQEIMSQIDNPSENFNEQIKEYVNKKTLKYLKNQVAHKAKKQNNYIDYIVSKLPIVETK